MASSVDERRIAEIVQRVMADLHPQTAPGQPAATTTPVGLASQAPGLHGVYPDVLERLLDRTKIACAVVDDAERPGSAHKTPLVEGMPADLGSAVTAWRTALPNALNTASMV